MADTEHSKCFARKGVRVQVPPSAPSLRPAPLPPGPETPLLSRRTPYGAAGALIAVDGLTTAGSAAHPFPARASPRNDHAPMENTRTPSTAAMARCMTYRGTILTMWVTMGPT